MEEELLPPPPPKKSAAPAGEMLLPPPPPKKKGVGFSTELPKQPAPVPVAEKGVGLGVKLPKPVPVSKQEMRNLATEKGAIDAKLQAILPTKDSLETEFQKFKEIADQNGGYLPKEVMPEYEQVRSEYQKLVPTLEESQRIDRLFNEKAQTYKAGAAAETVKGLEKKDPVKRIKLYNQALENVSQRFNDNMANLQQAKEAGDEEAVAQIQEQLKADSDKAAYFKKAIDSQKQIAKEMEDNGLLNNINIGSQMALGTFLRSVNVAEQAFTGLKNSFWSELGFQPSAQYTKEYEEFLKDYEKGVKSPSDVIAKVGTEVLANAEKRNEVQALNIPHDGSAYKAMLAGDYSQMTEIAAKGFLKSLPSSLMYINPYSATALSMGMVGQQIDEGLAEHGNITATDVTVGALKASFEVLTEKMWGVGGITKDLIKSFGKAGAKRALIDMTADVIKKSFGRKWLEQAGEEFAGEGVNQFLSNVVDYYIDGKRKNKDGSAFSIWDGVPDAAIIGLAGAATQGTLVTAIQHVVDKAEVKKHEELKAKANQLVDMSLQQESPVVAEALEAKAEKLNDEADKIAEKQNEIGSNASPETMAALDEQHRKLDELTASLETLEDPDAIEAVQSAIEQTQAQADELAKKAKAEAIRSMKEAEDNKKMYQGRAFMDETGLQPGLYTQEEVDAAKAKKAEAAKPVSDEKVKETEDKIKRKDLFAAGGTFSNILGGSGVDSVPTSHSEVDGIEFVQFSNPETGDVDVVMTGTGENDFVGYYRVYENGKPTNKWSSKVENKSRNKQNFKTMMSNAQSMLPEGHEYTETTSISTDGLRVWNQQLNRGYEVQRDSDGNIITNEVAINGDAISNELGIPVDKGTFSNIKIKTKEDFEKVKKALLPYLEKLGLDESNIRLGKDETGQITYDTVKIDLPVLKSTNEVNQTENKPINQKQNEKDNEVRNVQEGQGNEGNERGQQNGNEDGQNANVQEANGKETNGQKEVTSAVQEPGTGEVLQRQSQEAGVPGSERTGVEQSQQGQEIAKEGSQKEIVPPTEGATTTLPAASKYGQPREMVYKDGKWQQKIGREFTEVSTAVQKEAEAAFAATPAKVDAGIQTIRDAKESLKTWLAENHVVSSNPNIKQASIVDINKLIDVAFDIAEKAYTASKDIAQALNKAVEHVKASDWYNSLSNSEKRDAVNQVKGNVLEGIVLSNPELVKKTSEVAVSTESQVKPARKTFGWMYFGTKDKVRFLKFSGEATLDNLEQQSPDSYSNRAYDIAKYAIAKIDVRKNFFDAMDKFLGTDPNAEKYVVSVAKATVKKALAGKTVIKSLTAKKDDEASTLADKKKAKEMLKAVAASKTAEEIYNLLNDLPESFRTLGSKLIGDIFQARTFDENTSAVNKVKAKRKANKITASQATEEISEAIFRKKNIAEKVEEGKTIYNDVKEKFKGNLKFVYDLVSPAIRNLSKLWYDGANLIAQNFGKEYGLNVAQSSGIIASQSPQMPWFSNLHLAQAIMDIMANKKDEVFTKEFLDFYIKGAKKYADQIKYIPNVKALVGKKLGEMSDYDAAIFVRAYYELNMSRKAPVRLPSGVITGYETGDSSFGGYGTIEKGVSIFRNGSDENISEQLGDANKVRNFYNNIADPTNKKAVTIDTHAIAIANMLPLASNDYEVKFDPATYSLYSDAYNELAAELGLGARELQSITWEAARALFPAEKKSESGYKKKISDIWDAYKKGEITIEQARENIKQNGYNPNFTEWSEHLQDWLEGKSGSDYIRAINPKGFTPGSTTGGTSQGANGGVSELGGGNKPKGKPAVSAGIEKVKPVKNEKTKGLQYSETEGGIPMLSESGGGDYASEGKVQREEGASKAIFNSVVGVWNKFKNIQFSGTTKVKDASDVAHIMQLLENKSVEQSFAVHVDKSGKSHVQFLSIGGLTGTVIDPKAVLAGAKKFKAVSTYLVHNHPSGKLVPSQADLNITENIRKGFTPLGIKLEHIIMDTFSKEYVHIDEQGLYSVKKRDLSKADNIKLTTYVLDEQQIINEPISKVTNPNDAANFIQQLRFTAMPKNAVMLLSNDNKIIGNYVFQGEIIDYDQLTSFIAGSGVGNSVIFYGNQNNVDQVKGIKGLLKSLDVNVLDYIVVDSDSSSVQQYYNSIDLNSRLGETQFEYDTDSVAKSQQNEKTKGKEVSDKAVSLGSDQGGISEFTAKKIAEEDYVVKKISIEDLLENDSDLRDYIENTEDVREFEGEPFAMLPIASSKGEIIDGYNRIHQAIENGESFVEVYQGVPKAEELPVEGFKASEEGKKAAEIAIKMETAMAKAPSLKAKQTAKLSEEIEALKSENPEKAEVIDTIVNNIDAIRAQLLDAGIIESINCKWG